MWTRLSSKTLFKHPRMTLIEDTVKLPDGHETTYLRYDGIGPGAMIICENGGKVLLQREYSYPPDEVLYQFPGGGVLSGETPLAGARRELAEESGLSARTLRPLGWFYTDNRRSDQKMHVFLGTGITAVPQAGGDLEEAITSHWIAATQIVELIRRGEIVNYTVLAAWALYRAVVDDKDEA